MAFLQQSLGRQSASGNTPVVTLTSGVVVGSPNWFAYQSATDAIATIAASGYFNSQVATFAVNDVIYVVGSDANAWYSVATNNGSVITLSAFSLAGPVGTANIEDGAVTAAKLASDSVTTVKILAANVTSAKIDPQVIQFASGTISLANFIAMYTTPQILVAAPGSGKLIVAERVVLEIVYGSAQLAGGGAIGLQYDTTTHAGGAPASATMAAASFTAAVADSVIGAAGSLAVAVNSITVNKALCLAMASADFTVGTGSSFKYYVWYRVVTV